MTTSNNEQLTLNERLAWIGDLQQPLLRAGLKQLSNLSEADLTLVRQVWPALPSERRIAATKLMAEMAEEDVEFDFRPLFALLLDDQESAVRVLAIDGLWEDERISTLRSLVRLSSDPDGDVRSAAIIGLARFAYRAETGELNQRESEQLREHLFTIADDEEQPFDSRRRAIEALGYFANWPEAQELVGRAYAHPEQLMRESAVVAMGRSMRPVWFPMIERELRSPSPAMRYEAARALGEAGEEARRLVGSLVQLLDDEDSEIAFAAIWALGQIGGEQARRLLERITRSNNEARRQAALDALDELALDEL